MVEETRGTGSAGNGGTIYHCPIDNQYYKVTGANTAVRTTDPTEIAIANSPGSPYHISNWRDFHVEGGPGVPAGSEGQAPTV